MTADPALECLESGGQTPCRGPVEYRVSPGGKSWPRCAAHGEARWDRYEDSMEKYADTAAPPAWFDPSFAGERWDDE